MSLKPVNFRIEESVKMDIEKLAIAFGIPASQLYRKLIADGVKELKESKKLTMSSKVEK